MHEMKLIVDLFPGRSAYMRYSVSDTAE